ncbi:MAG TPA: PilZ domain-containing protein [bacterium]|nr:PilZ domain-containing protein [bacterium]
MAEGELYVERRRHKRIDRKFSVNYKIINAEDEAQEIRKSAVRKQGLSSDISLGGIKVEGEMAGAKGDIIRIEVVIEEQPEPVTTFAEVKWVREENGSRSFGLEFLILREADKEKIEKLLGE